MTGMSLATQSLLGARAGQSRTDGAKLPGGALPWALVKPASGEYAVEQRMSLHHSSRQDDGIATSESYGPTRVCRLMDCRVRPLGIEDDREGTRIQGPRSGESHLALFRG